MKGPYKASLNLNTYTFKIAPELCYRFCEVSCCCL